MRDLRGATCGLRGAARGLRVAAACVALLGTGGPARPQGALTSAPYDLSLFRDGETRRMRARFGRWNVVCDEIIRLHNRYCSLATDVTDGSGATVARLDVSTDDAGHPAALLHLPLGTLVDRPIGVGAAATAGRRPIRATSCDARDCAAVWRLDAGDFAALNRGGLALTFHTTARLDRPSALLAPADVEVVAARISADGFSDAIAASLKSGLLAESGDTATAATRDGGLALRH